ncbi:hypothetical protein SDJN02_05385, partial [Cucurbita argyrosperma subsp. argyrosperma]
MRKIMLSFWSLQHKPSSGGEQNERTPLLVWLDPIGSDTLWFCDIGKQWDLQMIGDETPTSSDGGGNGRSNLTLISELWSRLKNHLIQNSMSPTAVNISDNPKIRNCGVIQKIDIVWFEFTAESLLFFSIIAAETIENVERKRPKPIRFKGEIPERIWLLRSKDLSLFKETLKNERIRQLYDYWFGFHEAFEGWKDKLAFSSKQRQQRPEKHIYFLWISMRNKLKNGKIKSQHS